MTAPFNRQIVLARRPAGMPVPDDFRIIESAVPEIRDGEVLIRHAYLGLAPAARLRMSETRSYRDPLALGDVVYGQGCGVVVQSRKVGFEEGDQVMSISGGWQDYSVSRGAGLDRIDTAVAPPTVWLGALGTSGMTAWIGLLRIGQAKPGDTVVVSAASGGVGAMVGQIAKLKGCRAVGIAGGEAKVRHVVDDLGFDACVDYRSADYGDALQHACPDGIDVYFENVGGAVRDAVWPLMNSRGRIVVCGLIAEYNDAQQAGPGWFQILAKRLELRGFIMSDHAVLRPEFVAEMGAWYAAGKIVVREDISHGLEAVVPAFIGMLQGRNFGKTIVAL